MKRTRIIQLLACSLLLTACDKIEEPASSLPIDFSTTVDGADTRFASDDLPGSLGIIASQTAGDFGASAKLNFMYNQKLTRSGDTWDYSPKKYWPLDAADKVSFFTYAPHNARGVTLCDKTHEGYPSLTFTAPTAEADRVDLLAAPPIMNKQDGAVNFKLKHALTRVSIYAKSGDAAITGIKVHSTTVTAPQSGTLTFKQDGFGWTAATTTATFTLANTAEVTVPTTGGQSVLLGTFYLIPDRTKSSFNLSYTLSGSIAGGSNPPTAPTTLTEQAFPNTYEWTAGASIAYTVDIKRTGLEVVAESSSMEWASDVVNDIQVYGPDDLKPGDFYYSDGSWSDGGLRSINQTTGKIVWDLQNANTTNPVTGATRSCIGVVFSTRMDNYEKAMGWTNGYVMALSSIEGVWSTKENATDVIQQINIETLKEMYDDTSGCNLTKLNDYYGEYKTDKFQLSYACYKSFAQSRPAGTSEWFLPAMGHIWDLCEILGEQMPTLMKYRTSTEGRVQISNETFANINKHLKRAGGTEYMVTDSFWFSSSENSREYAVLLNSSGANPISIEANFKWSIPNRTGRGFPVFAF